LAELSWLEARRLDRHRRSEALDRYLDAAAYAFDFLLDPDPTLAAGRQPSDPRFRLAIDLYNGSLDRPLRAAPAARPVRPRAAVRYKVGGREQVVRVEMRYSRWKADDVDDLILASDLEVTGLSSTSLQQYGMGVPLIGVRRPKETDNPKGASTGEERFFPAE